MSDRNTPSTTGEPTIPVPAHRPAAALFVESRATEPASSTTGTPPETTSAARPAATRRRQMLVVAGVLVLLALTGVVGFGVGLRSAGGRSGATATGAVVADRVPPGTPAGPGAGAPVAGSPTALPSPADGVPPADGAPDTPPSLVDDRAPVLSPVPGGPSVVPPRTGPPAGSLPVGQTPASGASGQANPSGANLALGRPISASSSEGPPWVPANAVDGSVASRWGSAFSDPQWIMVDLGETWRTTGVRLVWERAYGTHYQVQMSLDGTNWTSIFSTTTGVGGTVDIDARATPARYVRMYGTRRSGQYGYSLLEFEVR